MTNGEEYTYGFVPNANDAFADADGDRYPNVFEVRKGSDPNCWLSRWAVIARGSLLALWTRGLG
jgi:hypothetical protein